MRGRTVLIVLLALILVLAAGVGYLGLYPPNPAQTPVQKTVPNDKFQAR